MEHNGHFEYFVSTDERNIHTPVIFWMGDTDATGSLHFAIRPLSSHGRDWEGGRGFYSRDVAMSLAESTAARANQRDIPPIRIDLNDAGISAYD